MLCVSGRSGFLTLVQVLQEQQEFHHMATDLAESLNVKLDISDIIPERLRQGSVRESLKAMMEVIEEILRFIKDHIDSQSISELRLLDVI